MTTASARFPLVSPAGGELDIGHGRKVILVAGGYADKNRI